MVKINTKVYPFVLIFTIYGSERRFPPEILAEKTISAWNFSRKNTSRLIFIKNRLFPFHIWRRSTQRGIPLCWSSPYREGKKPSGVFLVPLYAFFLLSNDKPASILAIQMINSTIYTLISMLSPARDVLRTGVEPYCVPMLPPWRVCPLYMLISPSVTSSVMA